MPQENYNHVTAYNCEVSLKFRLLEDMESLRSDPESLLDLLLQAFSHGEDDYLETTDVQVQVNPISDLELSPAMRQRLLCLRNLAA